MSASWVFLVAVSFHFVLETTNSQNQNVCWNLVPGQTNITLIRNSNSMTCGNDNRGWTVLWKEKEKAEYKGQFVCLRPLCTFVSDLKPYSEYNVKVRNYDGSIALSETVRTLEPAPGKICNLTFESVSAGNVTSQWEPPGNLIGKIRYYTVTIKRIKLQGCADYKKETPPESEKQQNVTQTMAFFTGLHPYAEYDFTVVANTVQPGPSKSETFKTEELDIPTANVSNFRLIDEKSRLAWEGPENCALITASTELVRLIFTGVSDWVQNVNFTVDVKNKEYVYDLKNAKLRPFTEYRVRAYYFRPNNSVNGNNFQELSWRTAPSVPPAVDDLGPYDLDIDNKTISVKWKPPYPANGVIESYQVFMVGREVDRTSIEMSNEKYNCTLSPDHVCLEGLPLPPNISNETELRLEVFARNVNVTADGAHTSCSFNIHDINKKEIGHPENVTIDPPINGIVRLKWIQPPFNPTKIVRFLIKAEIQRSDLINNASLIDQTIDYPVTQKAKIFSKKLYLLASTECRVSIRAVNYRNDSSNATVRNIRIPPSVAFTNGKKLLIKRNGTIANLEVPGVVGGTKDTKVIVLVEGLKKCLHDVSPYLSAITHGTDHFGKWMAAEYPVNHSESTHLTFDVDREYGEGKCSFQRQESYHFTVILVLGESLGESTILDSLTSTSFTPGDKDLSEEWSMIWLLFLSVPVLCLILLFVWYMKRKIIRPQPNLRDNLPLIGIMRSSNNSSSTVEQMKSRIEVEEHSVSTDEKESDLVLRNPNSEPVKVEEFEEYIKKAVESRLLESQWEILSGSLIQSCRYGYLLENRPKNQCNGAIPYDDNRVKLEKLPNEPYSDYINASYIQGYRKAKAYIAAQGPKRNKKTNTDTVPDFWRMVRQEKVQVICMLTNVMENGEKKCEQYWPEVGKNEEYGDAFVLNMDHQVFLDYTIRTLQLMCPDGGREIKHFHFTGWPDHGVPKFTQSLAGFMKKLLATPVGEGPMVVHGCAGVGRTGTLILFDICLRQAVRERLIDIPKVTFEIRQARANMVETVQQYLLAHLIIAECKILERTQIPCSNRLKEKILILRNQLPSDVQRLRRIVWQDRALHSLAPKPIVEDIATSYRLWRSDRDDFNPAEITLPLAPDARSDCFNVTSVEGVLRKDQYLAVQLPLPSNLPDLLNLVVQKKVELIVVLQRTNNTEDPTYYDVISQKPGNNFLPNIQVETTSTLKNEEYFTTEKLLLTNISKDEPRVQPVTILTCTKWPDQADATPPPVGMLVSLWMASERVHRKESPTLVICRDGVTGCGLYLALSFLLERMSLEGVCDVISAVRAIQRSRPDFVQSLSQFEYLYDAALNYNKRFDMYANFS